MENFAEICRDQGRLKEAQQIKIKVLELRKEILGKTHPDTIESIAGLVATYSDQYQDSRLLLAPNSSNKAL